MQQPSTAIELPQFTNLAMLALNLANAYTSWRAPGSGEDIVSYFAQMLRHRGDEHNLRATLIREHILPVFHYTTDQIEYESRERFDLTLWSQHKRRIALVETKSSSTRNLLSVRRGREAPAEQLERYLTQAGLYLGVLTNGDEWHLFDFAVGHEPLASFSLLELAGLLKGLPSEGVAEEALKTRPVLRQALAINFYYLDAVRWEQTDIFRQHLANPHYHRIASLQAHEHVETLVQQIKHVLGSLRETIRAQFALLQLRYDDYQQQRTSTSIQDKRPFEDALQAAIEKVVEFGTAFRMDEAGMLRASIVNVLKELTEHYFVNGDIAAFEGEYLERASELLGEYQIGQSSLLEKKITRAVRLAPPTAGLGDLKVLLQTHFAYLQSLDEDFALSKKVVEAYHNWQAGVRGVFSNPQDEFCLQTAYIHFVRLFFVRVCEDHDLIPRRISDGPFTRFEEYRAELLSGLKDTYLRLLAETYQRAHVVYHNFFGHQKFFDWFLLDEYTILALFDLLNRYDFKGLSADVLGQVYNEGYIETKERSEKGQFYTPPQVVDYMLNAIGIPGRNEPDEAKARTFLEKTVGDLSCGSGTFLVAAAARKSPLLQKLVASGDISPDYALQLITNTLLGFDLNPFACYLAEINLLIQCLPLLLDEQGQLCRSIERFHVYCTDSLEPTIAEQAYAVFEGKATERLSFRPRRPRGQVLTTDERHIISIKSAKGLPPEVTLSDAHQQPGIDYLLGNPPYVGAGESPEHLRYRNEVWNYGIYQLLHQRWDLFVPFFERNLQFLRPESGRLALIVSNGIETEGYAERLRQTLSSDYTLLQIDFFPGQRLFHDAAVANTIVVLENHPPDEEHEVIRRKHARADCTRFETLTPVPQVASNGQIFRWRYDRSLDQSLAEGSIPLCAIVYVGTGIEAQSKEAFDTVIEGKRQKIFTLDDVFLPPSADTPRPAAYTDEGVLGNDVDRYYLRRKRYVAYKKYQPQMRRPRHIALFRTPEKLLLGETSGGYHDRSGLFANHSVQVVVPWNALERTGAIDEKGIRGVLRESRQLAGIHDSPGPIAELFDLRYLLAIINSSFMRQYIASNMHEGTREGRVYPDVWKRLPIKVAAGEQQRQVGALVDAVQEEYRRLAALPSPADLAINPALTYRDLQGYIARGDLRLVGGTQGNIGEKPGLKEGRLILRRQPLMYLESSVPGLLRYIELYLTEIQPSLQGRTWRDIRNHVEVPVTQEALQTVMATIDNGTAIEQGIRTTISSLLSQIETVIETIYREPADANLLKIISAKLAPDHKRRLF